MQSLFVFFMETFQCYKIRVTFWIIGFVVPIVVFKNNRFVLICTLFSAAIRFAFAVNHFLLRSRISRIWIIDDPFVIINHSLVVWIILGWRSWGTVDLVVWIILGWRSRGTVEHFDSDFVNCG